MVCGKRRRYNLTGWAIKLNEITPGLDRKLAPTDCRLRPDQRATEVGDYDEVCLSFLSCTDPLQPWCLHQEGVARLSHPHFSSALPASATS